MNPENLKNYSSVLNRLKDSIRKARLEAVLSLNAQLLTIYWEIGNIISQQEKNDGWGTKIVDTLAKDLKSEFPEMQGLSPRNLRYMRDFAGAYNESSILQAPPAKLKTNALDNINILQEVPAKLEKYKFDVFSLGKVSWYHHTTLLDKVKDADTRWFYIQKTIENGWSRNVMVHQIEGGLHKRQGQLSNNFLSTIPPEQSELVTQIFKDPYKFDFIYLGKEAKERDLEDALLAQITKVLLELGQWFSFMGRQYKMVLGEHEYYFDLLFYHTRLKRYVIIDLKIDDFKPEYLGKMNFYLNIADEQLKQKDDEKSIGLVLCKTKDGLVAEYALRDTDKPIGIAEYKINEKLPSDITNDLPSIEDIERQMESIDDIQRPVDKKIERLKELVGQLKQEEVKEKRNKQNVEAVFDNVLSPLIVRIKDLLSETFLLFEEVQSMIWANNRGYLSDIEAKNILKEQPIVAEFRISFQFNGFKKAGKKAFSIWKDIHFVMDEYQYSIGFSRNSYENDLVKLYHQLPSSTEVMDLIDTFHEIIIDDITQHVERLMNS